MPKCWEVRSEFTGCFASFEFSTELETFRHIFDAMQSDENGFNLQEVVKVKRPKQEIRQEDISEWLAELEATQKEEAVVSQKGVKVRCSTLSCRIILFYYTLLYG